MAFRAKDLGIDLAKSTASIVVGAVASGGVNPSSVISAIIDVGGLAWKAGAYLSHRSTFQTSLAACLEEYREAGYLNATTTGPDTKISTWETTSKFSDARMLLQVYPDIAQFIKNEGITDEELRILGFESRITIYADQTTGKDLGDITHRLSIACVQNGIRDITKTDAEKRINIISFMQMGAIALQNAFTAEGQRRERGEEPAIVPVLGRVLGIVAMCGITEIALSEITTILGKGPLFETVARGRLAKLRGQHASQVLNTLLFMGNTESTARGFGQLASRFTGDRVMVGRVKAAKKSEFLEEYAAYSCQLTGPKDKKHEVGKPIFMMAGWANLIKQREAFEKEHGTWGQMVHLHAPTKEKDLHGNAYMSAGKLGKVVFKVKELADGSLMAKPRAFDRHDYKCKADYDKGRGKSKATGEEKLFGGIVGPVVCRCQGASHAAKGGLTKKWKLGSGIKISSRDQVANSIAHTQELSTKHVAVLWRPGDWLMGTFFMSVLPQSSYMQGRGECLHCAIENAALTGCAEVIACGGGRVSAAALQEADEEAATPVPAAQANVQDEVNIPVWSDVPEKIKILTTATALFDYEAQAVGDLSFVVGDIIDVISRTDDPKQWWTGMVHDKRGIFPANYVRLNQPQRVETNIITSYSQPVAPVHSRQFSIESAPSPSSPPPAYAGLSPSAPAAGMQMDYFAMSDASGDKIIPAPITIRRKPVPTSQAQQRATFDAGLLNVKKSPKDVGIAQTGSEPAAWVEYQQS